MQLPPDLADVLAPYGAAVRPLAAECLDGAGGFSGALFWKLTTPRGQLCLRRWPPDHPTPERLTWVHSVLRCAAANGFDRIPLPLATTAGKTWIRQENALWELTPWLPGRADFSDNPTRQRLQAAAAALAEFHVSVAEFDSPKLAPSPGLGQRVQQLQRLLQQEIANLAAAIHSQPVAPLQDKATRLLELFPRVAEPMMRALTEAALLPVPLQPCIRDIWHDHVLFAGERVSGLVDFGALRSDCVAGDVARLFGSLIADDLPGWQHGLAGYQAVRPLNEAERQLVGVFDASGILLGGMNWLDWVYRQHREFADLTAIRQRLAGLLGRLERLVVAGPLEY